MNFGSETLTRRRMMGLLGGAGVAAATGGMILGNPAAAAGPGTLQANRWLQIIAEPVGDAEIIGELAPGDYVTNASQHPEIIHGLREIVTQDGLIGWALDDGLDPTGGPVPDFPSARYMAHADNLVNKPGGHALLWVPFGKLVMASTTTEGDYIFVQVQGENLEYHQGWLLMSYLTPEGTQMLSVHDWDSEDGSAAMRTDPDPEAEVIVSVPANSSVLDYDNQIINGFRGVQWEDYVGWIAQEDLGRG